MIAQDNGILFPDNECHMWAERTLNSYRNRSFGHLHCSTSQFSTIPERAGQYNFILFYMPKKEQNIPSTTHFSLFFSFLWKARNINHLAYRYGRYSITVNLYNVSEAVEPTILLAVIMQYMALKT